ncbi:MAG TPA: hypothetical protein VET89_04580 [Stellaceae bacterium]|nr:hypothetical protein [Stellaceae bacterium]
MRFVLALVIVLLGAAFFAYPPLLEGTGGECSALGQRVAGLASHDSAGLLIVGALYGSSSSRPSAAAFVKDRYPLLPPAVGCAVAYWQTAFNPTAPALPAAPGPKLPPGLPPPAEARNANNGVTPIVARDITPNGDPISPATVFTLPMNSVAVRVDYPGASTDAVSFQLRQGGVALSSCIAQKGAPGTAWCKFDAGLRKGNYSISLTVNRTLLGQFPFTVIGR